MQQNNASEEPAKVERHSGQTFPIAGPIARELVLAHGGDIEIESVPGQGTEVTVALPR